MDANKVGLDAVPAQVTSQTSLANPEFWLIEDDPEWEPVEVLESVVESWALAGYSEVVVLHRQEVDFSGYSVVEGVPVTFVVVSGDDHPMAGRYVVYLIESATEGKQTAQLEGSTD